MSADLAGFLLQRIVEDGALAKDIHKRDCDRLLCDGCTTGPYPCDCGWPARVLAECEAKREIVQRCQMLIDSFERTVNGSSEYIAWTDVNRREKSHAWRNLYALVAPYADHPDFDPAWRS